MLWNHITQIDAAISCRNLYETVTTDLINSYAWDTAIVYIQNFSEDKDYSYQDGYTKSSLTNTGENGDKICQINDMSSNTYEWTTEYSSRDDNTSVYPCTYRGCRNNTDNAYTSIRYSYDALSSNMYYTFRCLLYM